MEYKRQLKRFDLMKIANLSVILFAAPFAVSMLLNLFVLKASFLLTNAFYWDILIIIAIYIVGLFAHEGLHALGAILFGKCSPKDIKFGVNLKQFMLYCHANKPMTVNAYRGLLLLPVIVTGIIPLIISTVFGNVFLLVVFSLLVSGGAGDFIMFFSLTKYKKDQLILDHPSAPAYYLYYPADSLPDDFEEVTKEQEEELLKEMERKPGESFDGKQKNNLVKILLVLLFLAVAVMIVFGLAFFMKLF